jgi:hypothetical protein
MPPGSHQPDDLLDQVLEDERADILQGLRQRAKVTLESAEPTDA